MQTEFFARLCGAELESNARGKPEGGGGGMIAVGIDSYIMAYWRRCPTAHSQTTPRVWYIPSITRGMLCKRRTSNPFWWVRDKIDTFILRLWQSVNIGRPCRPLVPWEIGDKGNMVSSWDRDVSPEDMIETGLLPSLKYLSLVWDGSKSLKLKSGLGNSVQSLKLLCFMEHFAFVMTSAHDKIVLNYRGSPNCHKR